MAMLYPIPINSKGIFTLLAPFDIILTPQVVYTCVSVRRISDSIASGEDPFEAYYSPYGLTQEKFNADLMADECIVSLQSLSGNTVHVPNGFISGLPNIGGVPYIALALGIELGLTQSSLNLEHVKLKVLEAIKDSIGVDAELQEIVTSDEILVSQAVHDQMEVNRTAAIVDVSTDYAKYVVERTLRLKAEAKIVELEAYIQAHPVP